MFNDKKEPALANPEFKADSLSDLKGKKILIVGLANTGVSLAHLLVENGAEVTVSDHKSKAELSAALEMIDGLELNYDLGGHTPKTFFQQDLIILSPGISPQLKIFEYAKKQGVRVTGEFEFVAQFIKEPVIAITGTNGKSTTCALIMRMLEGSGKKVWLGGNYGTPMADYLRAKDPADVLIVEVSSFMLEHVDKFKPHSIVFMNLAENHLDRHKTMEEYINSKRRIFVNTDQETTSILNADDNAVVELARDPAVQRGAIFYFSRKPSLEPQIMNIGGAVNNQKTIKVRTGKEPEVYSLEPCYMKGSHSIENIMAAAIASKHFGAKKEAIQKVIHEFPGMEHRIEYVRKVGGVKFYNDSKSTNVHSVLRALRSFDENVILIMGGKDTSLNYTPLQDEIKKKVKTLILVGEAKERINRDIGDFSETFLIGTFDEAVLMAYQKSRMADTILLSPGASSFDFFDNYRERGRHFKSIVEKF